MIARLAKARCLNEMTGWAGGVGAIGSAGGTD
jgi:hypothetical protein